MKAFSVSSFWRKRKLRWCSRIPKCIQKTGSFSLERLFFLWHTALYTFELKAPFAFIDFPICATYSVQSGYRKNKKTLYIQYIYIAYHKIVWNSPVTYFKPNLHILFVCTYIFIYVQCITYNVYTHNVIFYNIYFDGRVPPLMGIFTNNQSFNIKKK